MRGDETRWQRKRARKRTRVIRRRERRRERKRGNSYLSIDYH
jgi:hypothetical protein